MISNGNSEVWNTYDLHMGVEAARALYSPNFNSVRYPSDCPVWGNYVQALVHTAFAISNQGEWRSKTGSIYHRWSNQAKADFEVTQLQLSQLEPDQPKPEPGAEYRIAPLVTDAGNIGHRLAELGLVQRRDAHNRILRQNEAMMGMGVAAKDIMIATMNAGIRINYNCPDVLRKLASWIKDIKTDT